MMKYVHPFTFVKDVAVVTEQLVYLANLRKVVMADVPTIGVVILNIIVNQSTLTDANLMTLLRNVNILNERVTFMELYEYNDGKTKRDLVTDLIKAYDQRDREIDPKITNNYIGTLPAGREIHVEMKVGQATGRINGLFFKNNAYFQPARESIDQEKVTYNFIVEGNHAEQVFKKAIKILDRRDSKIKEWQKEITKFLPGYNKKSNILDLIVELKNVPGTEKLVNQLLKAKKESPIWEKYRVYPRANMIIDPELITHVPDPEWLAKLKRGEIVPQGGDPEPTVPVPADRSAEASSSSGVTRAQLRRREVPATATTSTGTISSVPFRRRQRR